jgi:uncharacterized protein YndB with AHSA1/START domain
MKPVIVETLIDAPPERVYQAFTDLEHGAERVRAIRKIEVLTPGPFGKGTRFRETRVMFGKEASETMEVVEHEHARRYVLAAESCGMRYRSVFEFEPERGGAATRVRIRMEATPVSLAAKLMAPLSGLMAKACAKALAADCADLKAVCEGSTTAPAPAG